MRFSNSSSSISPFFRRVLCLWLWISVSINETFISESPWHSNFPFWDLMPPTIFTGAGVCSGYSRRGASPKKRFCASGFPLIAACIVNISFIKNRLKRQYGSHLISEFCSAMTTLITNRKNGIPHLSQYLLTPSIRSVISITGQAAIMHLMHKRR